MDGSPNSPIFGEARWPGTESSEYRPFDANTQYDPDFSTESYDLSDMEPSPNRPVAPSRRTAAAAIATDATPSAPAKKKRNRQRALKVPPPGVCEEYAPGRTNYQLEETLVLARSWVDISEDPIFANNQRQLAYWERIAERYNAAKPPSAYKRKREQLRKHWDQIKKQINLFSAEYEKCERAQGSGESLNDVRTKALMSYQSMHGEFKHEAVWALLRDKQKFQGGILHTGATKRAKTTETGGYTSSESGTRPVDLNRTYIEEESSGTPMSSLRPIGVKAAKAKGKATATSSSTAAEPSPIQVPNPLPSETAAAYESLATASMAKTLLKTSKALKKCTDPAEAEILRGLIDELRRKLGIAST